MMNFTMSKDNSTAKIKTSVKKDMIDKLIEALGSIFGEDNVAMVRVGTASSQSNVIAVKFGTCEDGDKTYDVCATVDVTAKDFTDRVTASKTYLAFDFDAARANYLNYIEEKEAKEAEKAKAKAEKIKKSKKEN